MAKLSHESIDVTAKLPTVMEDRVDETSSSRPSSLVSHLLKLRIYGKAVFEVLETHPISIVKQIDVPGAVFSEVAI